MTATGSLLPHASPAEHRAATPAQAIVTGNADTPGGREAAPARQQRLPDQIVRIANVLSTSSPSPKELVEVAPALTGRRFYVREATQIAVPRGRPLGRPERERTKAPRASSRVSTRVGISRVKKIVEVICCILHPIAVLLIWCTVWFQKDLRFAEKLLWAVVSIVPFVPFLYVFTGHDFL